MKKIIQFAIAFSAITIKAQAGSLDTSFGTGGKVITSINNGADKAYSVTMQSDGKIIVGGMTTSASTGQDFVCIRYNNDGTLDTSFASGGIFTNDMQLGSDDVVYSVVIQSDGKIILAGSSDDGSNKNAAMLRLNSNGTIDTTFGTAGKVLTDFITGRADEIKTVKIHLLTGNIIVGGTSAATTTNSQAVIARYTSAGILDTTFNSTGKVLLSPNSGSGTYYNVIEDLTVKANGKISGIGWVNQQGLQWSANHYGCRLNSNGTLDTTFSSDGMIVTNGGFNGDDKSYSMILKSDDSILFSGGAYLTSTQYDYFLGLFDSAGSTAVGKAFFDYGTLIKDIAYGMGIDSTGKIVLAGSNVSSVTSSTFGISRVNANYTVDNTFGTAGRVTTTFGSNTANEAFDMVIQADDKIIAVGYTGNDFAIARYSPGFLSTSETQMINQFSIYPNPVKDILYIKIVEKSISNSDYKVLDAAGRVVLSGVLSNDKNQVNVNSLEKGIYFLKIANKTEKFIKN